MASKGFLPVSRVTSPSRAATTEGNRFTHSEDRSPEESRIPRAYWCPKSQRPVEALHDALVPVDVNPTVPNLDRVLRQQLNDRAHEVTAGVNLKKLRPPQGAPLVIPSKDIGDLCRNLASQGLSLFVTAGDVNDRESVTDGFPSYAVLWHEEQVGLMDLVWHRNVKLRPWYVPWGGMVDLPDGQLFEPVLSLLLSHLCCRRQLFDGCEPLLVASGAVVNASRRTDSLLSTSIEICKVFKQSYKPPTCGSRGPRKLSSSRPEVGRASQHPCGKTHCGLLIPSPELERLLRDIDHGVGQRAGIFYGGEPCGLEHCIIQFVGQHRLSTTCKHFFNYLARF